MNRLTSINPIKTICLYGMIATSLFQASLVSAQQDIRGFQAVKGFYDQSWALLVGINKYKHGNNLNFAVNDVNRTRKVLVNRFGFQENHILTLLDEQATKKNIEDAMSKFADPDRIGKNDRVLIFFSGHGATVTLPRGKGQMGFLITHDAENGKLDDY